MWQGAALDALAAWLAEDGPRVEPRLAGRDACARFVALFAAQRGPGADAEAQSRLLDPFLRILRRSPRISVRARPWFHAVGTGDLRRLQRQRCDSCWGVADCQQALRACP